MSLTPTWKPTWNEILDILRAIATEVMTKTAHDYYTNNAQEILIDGLQPPVDEREDLLHGLNDQITANGTISASQRRAERSAAKRVAFSGDPQSRSDRFANKKMRELLNALLGDYIDGYGGEEYEDEDWLRIEGLPGGTRFLLIDDLDGSTLLEVQGCGYSVNLVLYGRTRTLKNVPLASVTVDSRGWALLVDRRQERVALYDATSEGYTLLTGDEYQPRDAHVCLAVVARSGGKRARIASVLVSDGDGLSLPPKVHGGELITNPAADVSTLGGAPAIMQYMIGGLGMVVLIDNQTIWDTAPLLGAPLLGLSRYYSIETEETYEPQDVLDMFTVVARPTASPERAKPVKAMLVVRREVEEAYPEAVKEILRRLRDDYVNPKRLVAKPLATIPGLRLVDGTGR